jgi:prevent-host-death family protein
MGKHSVVDAKNQLSELIDRALCGEDIVITRHGRPVVALKPIAAMPAPISLACLDRLADLRARLPAMPDDAGTSTSAMRDHEWNRC